MGAKSTRQNAAGSRRWALSALRLSLLIITAPLWIAGLLIAVIFLLPGALWHTHAARVRGRRFIRTCGGKAVLVWTSRHGWHDFICNNVIPVLPAGIVPVRTRRTVRHGPPGLGDALGVLQIYGVHRPFLLTTRGSAWRAVPLHAALLPWKRHARRNAEVGQQVAEVIRTALVAAGPQPAPKPRSRARPLPPLPPAS